jgi:hypothetical protein
MFSLLERPRCGRCNGPLDLLFDPEDDREEWVCNNPNDKSEPAQTDEQFWRDWHSLSTEEKERLINALVRRVPEVDQRIERLD